MKKVFLGLSLFVLISAVQAQKKTTTSATVAFDASTSVDALPKAENKTVIAALDTKTGDVQFEANVKNFAFSNPSMQGHFNGERWMNSDTYPSFSFKGKISNLSAVNFSKDGNYTANVDGILKVKGKEKKITTPAAITVKGGSVSASADFIITLADFDITGVPIDAGKVSKKPKITVKADFK